MTKTDEIRYRILKALDDNPHLSQRELARGLGVSLGKVNYCLRAIIARGWVKARSLDNGESRRIRAYFLTRKGFEEKAKITVRFLKHRREEYEVIRKEIARLQREAARDSARLERPASGMQAAR